MKHLYHYIDPHQSKWGISCVIEVAVYSRITFHLGHHEFYYSKVGPKLDYVRQHFEGNLTRAQSKVAALTADNADLRSRLIPIYYLWDYPA